MSWLLELLVDAIREMCSQFIVDMMELITNMFTELLSCNLSLFEELFSVVGSLYKNVIVPTGIAILLMILVWQLFKSMFGGKAGVNAEEPIELICRSAISLFLLAGSKPLIDYILRIAGTPYQWVVGTKVKVASFSGYVSTLEGVTDTLGISSLSISVLMLIMQFVVAWNYFKMLMVIAERYVLLGVFSYTAPLAFATGGSKATNNILASWSKMFGGQVVLVILNAWCMKMFLSGYGNMMASSYGFTKFFAATLCLVGFCKITFKLDSYMASLGVNLGRPAPGMGAAGAMLAASRIISQVARTASGSGGTGDIGGTRTDMGSSDGMTTNFTGPIPMTPNGGNAMDINDMTSDGDFDKESPSGPGNQQNEASPADKTVFEELGMTTGSSDTAEMDFGSGDHINGNIDSMSATSETMSGINAMGTKDDAEAFAGAVSESNSEGETLLDVSGGEQDLAIPAASNVSANGFSESGSEHGILGEMGDYPVEEEMSDFDTEMDLESGSIEMAGQESMSYGKTGTAYNSSVAGEVSNAGEGLGSETMSALQGNGIPSVSQEKGILDEVGTSPVIGFDTATRAGMNYNENSMPTGMESMSEKGIQSDGIMDTGEDLAEETDEADFYAKSAMGILADTAGNPLKAENTKLSDSSVQNEDDIQPTADAYLGDMIQETAKTSERLTDKLRRMTLEIVVNPKEYEKYKEDLVLIHGIELEYKDEILRVSAPVLIPHRKDCYTDYLYKPLHTAFRNWCMQRAEEKLEIPTYTNCTICFVHVYDETLPLARVRDHDNYEEKHVQDIITNFFLQSDSGLYTNTCHVTRMGEEDRTLLYVMDSSKFPAWISDFGKETGIEKNHE